MKNKGGQIVRTAGAGAQILAKEGDYAQLRLPSSEIRKVHLDCRATIGQVGNLDHQNISIGKAGRSRWMGWRPHVRGTAMNPIDHPHGGGEGRSKGGRHPVSPEGIPTKGYKTRRNKRTRVFIVKEGVNKDGQVVEQRSVYRYPSFGQDQGAGNAGRKAESHQDVVAALDRSSPRWSD